MKYIKLLDEIILLDNFEERFNCLYEQNID